MDLLSTSAVPRYLFLDLNSYFASCEQQDKPDLRREPVAVVPCLSDGTCAIAASYEAKAYGIRTGTKIYDAKRMCPTLKIVQADHKIYVEYHERMLSEFVKHTPLRRVWSIDECDSRLLPQHRNAQSARDLAIRIKEGLRHNVGEYIRASIGIAPNSFLAKVATDIEKPNGLVVLEPHTMKERLFALELRDLPGIGYNMEIRLRRAGIYSVEDLWNCHPKRARAIWRGVGGERFWYNLRGVEIPETETQRGIIGHSRVLDPEHRDPETAYQIARRLTSKAVYRLRREGYYATRLSLSVKSLLTRRRWGAEYRMPQTNCVNEILAALQTLWHPHVHDYLPGKLLQVNICLYGLIACNAATGDLFASAAPKPAQHGVDDILEKVNSRFGPQTLNLGMIPKLSGAPIGTKIAFARVPDLAEFEE